MLQWISKFWDLITLEFYDHAADENRMDLLPFDAYAEFHQRVSKTIQSHFNAREEAASAREDWEEDLARAHADVIVEEARLQALNYQEFSDAIFQLVDVWCGPDASARHCRPPSVLTCMVLCELEFLVAGCR